jgi:acetyltransferase-like isoleucine patch superfamily enzyme/acyl carrier protein
MRRRAAPDVRNTGELIVGERVEISSLPIRTHIVVTNGASLRIGDDVRIGHGCGISCESTIHIGDRTVLGPFVQLLDSDFHVAGSAADAAVAAPITVGADVRLGAWVTVLAGSRIGDRATVEPGSVVSGSIEAGATVRGNPALADRHPGSTPSDDTAAVVVSVVQEVLDLASPPALEAGPSDIEGWTSLGALRVLISLEEALDVRIAESVYFACATIADLVDAIEQAREVVDTRA